jgi:hypothetical protein
VATLKPLNQEILDKKFVLSVPPLEPPQNENFVQFLKFLSSLQIVIFIMQIIAYIQNVFLDGRSH